MPYRDAELLAVALHQTLRGDTSESTALANFQNQRDEALRDVFELTCGLVSYRPVPTFVELQKRLSRAIDVEASALAARPTPRRRDLAVA